MYLTPEQKVVDRVASEIRSSKRATTTEAQVLVAARFAYRAGVRLGEDGISTDIPALIERELPISKETETDNAQNVPNRLYKQWLDSALGKPEFKQQVFGAFNEGQSNG